MRKRGFQRLEVMGNEWYYCGCSWSTMLLWGCIYRMNKKIVKIPTPVYVCLMVYEACKYMFEGCGASRVIL